MDKAELRKKYISLRNQLTHNERYNKSCIIFDKLLSSDKYKNAGIIFCYISMGSEIETRDFISNALSDGKTLAAPVVLSKKNGMEFRTFTSLCSMKKSYYGAFEPVNGELILPNRETIIIVPGAVFSYDFYRIGYGGGYYDRYLGNLGNTETDTNTNTIGVCFDFQLIENVPNENYDIPVEMIITENRILTRK